MNNYNNSKLSLSLGSLYESIFDFHPLPICIIDTDTLKILNCNKAFGEIFGYTKQELIGESLQNLQKENLHDLIQKLSNPSPETNLVTQINCIHKFHWTFKRVIHIEKKIESNFSHLILYYKDSLNNISVQIEKESKNSFISKVEELIQEIEEHGRILHPEKEDLKTKLFQILKKSHFETVQRQHAIDQHAIVAITDKKGAIIYANSRFCAISKYRREELIGKNHRIINSGYHSKYFFQNMYDTITKGDTWHGEIRNKAKDGSYYWVATTIAPLVNVKGEIEQYISIRTDITERVKAESALRISEANMKAIFDNSTDSIIFINLNQQIQFFNEIASKRSELIVGKKLQIGFDMKEILSVSDYFDFSINFRNSANGQRILFDRLITNEKGNLWFEIQYAPVKNKENQIIGVLFTARDITLRKQAEEKVYASQMFARAIIDSVTAHICVLDKNGLIQSVNKAWMEFAQINDPTKFNSCVGMNYLEICDNASGPWSDEAKLMAVGIRSIMSGEKEEFTLEYPCHSLEKKLWFSARVTRFHDNSGNIVIAHEIITDRKLAEEELENSLKELESVNQMKNKFFNIIAHDLRNPFAGIIGITEILETKFVEENIENKLEFQKFTQMILTSSRSAFALLENLMQWARSQTNDLTLNIVNLSIQNIIHSTISLVEGNAFTKKITIEENLTYKGFVKADEKLLNTILRNLITNAIKFTHQNGKIILSDEVDSKFLKIKITDSGTGISEENLNKIFRIDSKFTKQGTENEKGSGLGLILCKEFIELQGGKIQVESKLGEGSTFTISLPLVD